MTSPPSAPVCAHGNNPEYCIHCVHIEPPSAPDLVARLQGAADGTLRPVHAYSLCSEAAAEIERLTREQSVWRGVVQAAQAEQERLRAALEHLANLESRLGHIPEEQYYEELAKNALDGEDISAWYRAGQK